MDLSGRHLATGLRRGLRELRCSLFDLLCPPTCPGCGADSDGLCEGCRGLLDMRRPPWCERCGTPTLAMGSRCQDDHRRLQGLVLARAPFAYRGTGGAIVRRIKFSRDRNGAEFSSRAMAGCVRSWVRRHARRACVVAVPLHPAKRRRRGFDQTAILAERVAQRLGLVWLPRALIRVRDTLPQGDPRVMSRQQNVADAFAVGRARGLGGRTVILIDDVSTSGSTARACAAVLRGADVSRVALLTAAKA